MFTSIEFLSLTSKQPAETAGSIAYSKPQLFKPAETAGSIASSSTPSMSGSTPAGCGSSCNTVA